MICTARGIYIENQGFILVTWPRIGLVFKLHRLVIYQSINLTAMKLIELITATPGWGVQGALRSQWRMHRKEDPPMLSAQAYHSRHHMPHANSFCSVSISSIRSIIKSYPPPIPSHSFSFSHACWHLPHVHPMPLPNLLSVTPSHFLTASSMRTQAVLLCLRHSQEIHDHDTDSWPIPLLSLGHHRTRERYTHQDTRALHS